MTSTTEVNGYFTVTASNGDVLGDFGTREAAERFVTSLN